MRRIHPAFGVFVVWLTLALPAGADDSPGEISKAQRSELGWLTHCVHSPLQQGETKINVLLPDEIDRRKKHRVVYLLPVEARDGTHWGDAMQEAARIDLANKHHVICVYPTFSHLPWYADHPTDEHLQQETYFLTVVAPFVEREYPALAQRDGRLLVGFSKSGWGAWSLLLRHPEMFAAAAAWDAPLMETQAKRYGMGPIFGSDENFQKYRIDKLIERRAKDWGDRPRLVLTGYGNFRRHHQQAHELLARLKTPHIYRDGPQRRHHWESGWLDEAVELLLKDAATEEPSE